MTGRDEISSERWTMIEAIVASPEHMGRPRRDDSQMLNGILWISALALNGEIFRNASALGKPFTGASGNGVRIVISISFCATCSCIYARTLSSNLDTWMVDSTSIWTTQLLAVLKKGLAGTATPLSRQKPGRTDDQIPLACDSHGFPLAIMLSPGEQADSLYSMSLLDQISLPGSKGRPRKRCRYVLADKGYDSQVLRHYRDRCDMQPVIPLRKMHRKPRPCLPRLFDGPRYKKRNVIERLLS